MKLIINDIERECTIVQVPRYCFSDNGDNYSFPAYACIAPAMDSSESVRGNVLVCSIDCFNGGYEEAIPARICDELYLYKFKEYIHYYCELYTTEIEAASFILKEFERRNILIQDSVYEYFNELKSKYDEQKG